MISLNKSQRLIISQIVVTLIVGWDMVVLEKMVIITEFGGIGENEDNKEAKLTDSVASLIGL